MEINEVFDQESYIQLYEVQFCSCDKSLYYIYFDNEDAVVAGTCAQS